MFCMRLIWVFALSVVSGFDPVFPLRRDSQGPFLYIGSHADATNIDSLRLLRIRYILLVGKRDSALKVLDIRRDYATYETLEALDDLQVFHFRQAYQFMNSSYEKALQAQMPESSAAGANLLVVSPRGCQRAGSVAAAFIAIRLKITAPDAVRSVEKQRSCFKGTPRLLETLSKLQDVAQVTNTEEEVAKRLLKDVGRKVTSRSLTAQNLENCNPMHDTYWYYGDLHTDEGDSFDAKSSQDCCELCDLHPRCLYWSYGLAAEHKDRCYLKSGDGSYMATRAHFVSGQRRSQPKSEL